jgi:hypothetical protein
MLGPLLSNQASDLCGPNTYRESDENPPNADWNLGRRGAENASKAQSTYKVA